MLKKSHHRTGLLDQMFRSDMLLQTHTGVHENRVYGGEISELTYVTTASLVFGTDSLLQVQSDVSR